MGAEVDNYRYNEDGMANYIDSAKQTSIDMKQIGENIENIVRKNLVAEGITGDTGEMLLSSFREYVLAPMEEYNESVETSIRQNEKVQEVMEENSAANTRVISSI